MSPLERCLQSEASSSYWERTVEIGGAGALDAFGPGCRRNCILICRFVPAMLRCVHELVSVGIGRGEDEAVGCLVRRWDERSETASAKAGASQLTFDAKRRYVPKDERDSFVASNECRSQFVRFDGQILPLNDDPRVVVHLQTLASRRQPLWYWLHLDTS